MFLPGESHGQRSLVGYSPWGHKDLTGLSVLAQPNHVCASMLGLLGFSQCSFAFKSYWIPTTQSDAQGRDKSLVYSDLAGLQGEPGLQCWPRASVWRGAWGSIPSSCAVAAALLGTSPAPAPAVGPRPAFSWLNHPHPQLSHCPAFWPPGLLWLSCKPSGLWKSNLTVEENEKVGVFSYCVRAGGCLIIRWPGSNGRRKLRNYSQDPW